jgi:hypothetical protein
LDGFVAGLSQFGLSFGLIVRVVRWSGASCLHSCATTIPTAGRIRFIARSGGCLAFAGKLARVVFLTDKSPEHIKTKCEYTLTACV